MKTEVFIKKEIDNIISLLIELGLCDDQNFTSITESNGIACVTFDKSLNLSIPLKNIEYDKIYDELVKDRQYTMKLADGNLIQLMYEIQENNVISHRLTMFPSKHLESFQNEPEFYVSDCIYADILKKNVVAFPIRFDFSVQEKPEHPFSHLSLGQFENCRIPVFGPVMPKTFINFILKNFYNTFFVDKGLYNKMKEDYEKTYTIRENEKKEMHIFVL